MSKPKKLVSPQMSRFVQDCLADIEAQMKEGMLPMMKGIKMKNYAAAQGDELDNMKVFEAVDLISKLV